ncbi:hypothetical protein SAMN04487912_11470 [Arthrobacter sp. cf158]|nr:hypothetical protein SAMN04487912_11470 [Arthrobacter sp. cf158]
MNTYPSVPPALLPGRTLDNEGFWENARRHQLVIPECRQCDHVYYPISPRCPNCFSEDVGWQRAPTTGIVSSWVRYHKRYYPWIEPPYIVALVELLPTVRMTTLLWPPPSGQPAVGSRVSLGFVDLSEEVTLPVFALDESPEQRKKPV